MSCNYIITRNTAQKLKMLFKLNAIRIPRAFEKQRIDAVLLRRFVDFLPPQFFVGAKFTPRVSPLGSFTPPHFIFGSFQESFHIASPNFYWFIECLKGNVCRIMTLRS